MGGVETGTVDLAKHLVSLGHKAVVVSAGGELTKELDEAGVRHYELPVHKKSIFMILRNIKPLVEIIKKENIDIVHARSRVPAWVAYFACRKTKKVLITTCHGYYSRHFFSFAMGWGKRVITLSNVIARHMIDDFGVSHERIRLVPRSVDLAKFKYTSPRDKKHNEFNVGIIGRITPLKGHLDFIKAMHKATRSIPRMKIWIVGDAPASKEAYKEQLQVLVRRLGLWHCTEFLGTQRDIPAIMANLDLLVLATTTQEAFGRVIIEAQAAGVPVVATKVGGVVDIIEDGKTGLLVPPGDTNAMAEAVVKVFKDACLAVRLSQDAYRNVKEKYNLELMVKNTIEVYKDALSNFKILIIKLSSAGDIVLSTAALRAIREKFTAGSYKISLLVSIESKDILSHCPYIDELLVCDLKNKDKGFKNLLKLGRKLRRENFDIVIDLQNSRSSHILAGLSFAPERYGYGNKKYAFFLNHKIKDTKPPVDPLSHQFRILEMMGIQLKDRRLELWPSLQDEQKVAEFLNSQWVNEKTKLVGINISASQRWFTKRIPLETVAEICDELIKRDIRTIVTGTTGDADAAGALVNMAKNAKIINACGKTTINQLAALIKHCAVYISCDSAPLHVAASVNTPVVALFGPTDPRRHLLVTDNTILIQKDIDCSPCYKPKCKTNKCMNGIAAEEILEAVDKLLKQKA